MKTPILAAFALSLLSLLATAKEATVVVADSGSPQIDRLVAALVSRVPAPLPNGGKLPSDSGFAEVALFNKSGRRCATEEVESAFQKLKTVSPKDYRFLLKHGTDDRYSYSMIGPWGSPTMSGWMNYSVGQAIDEILSNEMSLWVGGYKSREGADGKGYKPLSFSDYVEANGGYEAWAVSVSSLSRKEIDIQFVEWCICVEEKRGFQDVESRTTILGRYKARIQEVEQARAGQPATRPESEGGDKPQPDAEGRSR